VADRFQWKISDDAGVTQVTLSGPVNEDAVFTALGSALADKPHVRMDVAGISRINSCGVREWVTFIRSLPRSSRLELERCSPVFVSQMNMISNFSGSAAILSVQAPFVCNRCRHEETLLFPVGQGPIDVSTEQRCSQCSGDLLFDDLEERYFAFLG